MDIPPPNSLSAGQIVLMLLASALSGGAIIALVNRLANWASGRSKAEVVEIHARSVKLETESQQINASMLLESMERIRDLVEINSQLQDELNETGRIRDNCEYQLKLLGEEYESLKLQHQLREYFIDELVAANKLGVKL